MSNHLSLEYMLEGMDAWASTVQRWILDCTDEERYNPVPSNTYQLTAFNLIEQRRLQYKQSLRVTAKDSRLELYMGYVGLLKALGIEAGPLFHQANSIALSGTGSYEGPANLVHVNITKPYKDFSYSLSIRNPSLPTGLGIVTANVERYHSKFWSVEVTYTPSGQVNFIIRHKGSAKDPLVNHPQVEYDVAITARNLKSCSRARLKFNYKD